MKPEIAKDSLASAHRANLARHKVVPPRLIWLSGLVSGGITTFGGYMLLAEGWGDEYKILVLVPLLSFVLGYLSAVILGIWADVRFSDTQYALGIPLFFWLAFAYVGFGVSTGTGLLFCFSPFVIGTGMLGSRLGMYANRIRWDRKVSAGRLPVVFAE